MFGYCSLVEFVIQSKCSASTACDMSGRCGNRSCLLINLVFCKNLASNVLARSEFTTGCYKIKALPERYTSEINPLVRKGNKV